MTASTNGRADVVGPPITLGDFLPERRQVVINGESHLAWVTTNRRYPRSIMARLDRAARVYNTTIAALLDTTAPPEARLLAADDQPEAWQRYVTESILLLIPDLLESEIELIDLDSLENLLRELGYFKPLDAEVESVESEVAVTDSDPLTGDTLPQDSADSTLATPTTNN